MKFYFGAATPRKFCLLKNIEGWLYGHGLGHSIMTLVKV